MAQPIEPATPQADDPNLAIPASAVQSREDLLDGIPTGCAHEVPGIPDRHLVCIPFALTVSAMNASRGIGLGPTGAAVLLSRPIPSPRTAGSVRRP